MFVGKLILGILGLLVVGIPGLIFGLFFGHLFDRGLASVMGHGGAGLAELKQQFFRSVFRLMGHVAKADGRISEEEVTHTEQIFRQLGIGDEQRHEAILLFKEGAEADFSVEGEITRFLQAGGAHPTLKQTLYFFLVSLAYADGQLHEGERAALEKIGEYLGYSADAVAQLLRMATAQEEFHQQPGRPPSAPSLESAYAALGVDGSASDAEVKRAYRKLMSQNHPDKLSARGVPEDMLRIATEKSQEIQAAYELVRKARGASKAA
ncbi:MAG: co-chaperone DjlA [Halieaceae bacterium]|jgi:DnaJ like chaperone protein|nr:co-chaperone DjlA [Halieaceae bacterium]